MPPEYWEPETRAASSPARIIAATTGLLLAVALAYGIGSGLNALGAPTLAAVLVAALPIVAYGWIVDRWWAAFLLPVIVAAVFLIVLRIVDAHTGGCTVCGEDEDWSNYPLYFGIGAVLPVTVLASAGLGLRGMRNLYRQSRYERARRLAGS